MKLDKYEPLDLETVNEVFNLAELRPRERHIDLGSGDGRLVAEATKRGAVSCGYELSEELARDSVRKYEIKVINDDCFNADVSDADVVTCWLTELPGTQSLIDKLHKEMKIGSRLIKIGKIEHTWKPKRVFMHRRHWLCLYVKE